MLNNLLYIIIVFSSIMIGCAFVITSYFEALLVSIFTIVVILYIKGEPNTVKLVNRFI